MFFGGDSLLSAESLLAAVRELLPVVLDDLEDELPHPRVLGEDLVEVEALSQESLTTFTVETKAFTFL